MKHHKSLFIMLATSLLITFFVVASRTNGVYANAGSGSVITSIGDSNDYAKAIAIQEDGKIIVEGGTYDGQYYQIALVRYNSDLTLDPSFGNGGIVITPTSYGVYVGISDIVLQDDGKILVTTTLQVTRGHHQFSLFRYNPDGSLDTNFGNNGYVTTSISGWNDGSYHVAVQDNGKIIIGGDCNFRIPNEFCLVRYETNGDLDTSFGNGGIVVTVIGPGYDQGKGELLIQSDGKIILTGSVEQGAWVNRHDFGLARYNPDGSLDVTFGNGGIVITDFGTTYEYGTGAVIQEDGKILITGYVDSHRDTYVNIGLARYNPDGQLDGTFGDGGRVVIDISGTNDLAYSLVLQGDDKILTAGATHNGSDYDVALLRFNIDGTLDVTFGINGIVTTDFGLGDDFGMDLAIEEDTGKIVVAGHSSNGIDQDFMVVRYRQDGSIDDNTPPVAQAGGPYSVDEGNTVIINGSGSDPDNDPLIFAWDLDNDGIFETPGQSVVFSAVSLDGPDTQAVAVQVCDTYNGCDVDDTEIQISNVAPIVDSISAPIDPVQIGTEINSTVAFSDQGIPDTHTATWDWGDVTSSDGVVTESGGSGRVAGNHIYDTPGVYTVSVTVTDDDGGSASNVFQYVVVYDPEGGFVTGGGWFNSPVGAYYPDPTLTGKATFGFVSKYKKGADVPTGNTEFHFNMADLNFHSTEYQWLVVAGAKAKFKGFGTINDEGNYGFMISAIDEKLTPSTDVDLFRIKIWDIDNGDVVIYDNLLGVDDDADPTTALGGGSIVIHKAK